MSVIIVTGRKILAPAIAHKWPGAVVGCVMDGNDTHIEWDDTGPIPVKTEAEINAAQDEYDLWRVNVDAQNDKAYGLVIQNQKVTKAIVLCIINGELTSGMTNTQAKAAIKARM